MTDRRPVRHRLRFWVDDYDPCFARELSDEDGVTLAQTLLDAREELRRLENQVASPCHVRSTFSDPSEFDPNDFGDPDDDRVIWLCDGPYKDGYHRIVKARDLQPGDEVDGRVVKSVSYYGTGISIGWTDDPTTDYYPPGSIVLLPPIVE